VTFNVTATDGVDGAVPVSCRPRSGSRFKLGRTTVRCEATDSSGNATKAAVSVTVKRGR
jgi:HYR domain